MTVGSDLGSRIRRHVSREAWLAARGIGASEVAAIRGRSPFATAWDVWVRRQPGVEASPVSDGRQAEGQEDEELVALKYERRTGRRVERVPHLVVEHPEFAWATCSPDSFVDDTAGGLEIKTDAVNHGWGPDGTVVERGADAEAVIPCGYDDQVFWCLEVTGLPWWDVAAWLARPWGFPELRVFRVRRDEEHQRRLLLEVALWRERHLVGGEMPDIDASSDACRRWHASRPAASHKRERDADPDEAALVAELMFHLDQVRRAKRERDRIEIELHRLYAATNTHCLRLPGSGVRCKRVRTSGAGHRFTINYPRS